MCVSIFDAVQGRSGEKLIQGLLHFLLVNDEPFATHFCEWAGWESELESIKVEESDGIHRHDLSIKLKGEKKAKNVELKLWAGFTYSQQEHPEEIDLYIVPERYQIEAPKIDKKEKVKTWEELSEKVINQSEFARKLLRRLDDFAWDGKLDRDQSR